MRVVLSNVFTRLVKVPVTGSYAALVAALAVVSAHMSPDFQDALIRHTSTNLHNLGHGRFGTLVGSAFVVDAGPLYLWLPGLICLLAAAELAWGSRRMFVATAVGHVGATVIVALGLVVAVKLGWVAHSVAHEPDVGMSYVAMAALGVLTGAIPPRWRPAWAGWWLGVALVIVAAAPGFTDVGHAAALSLGMTVSARSGMSQRWTLPTIVLAGIGAAFGYLVLTGDVVSMVLGAAWGALGAFMFQSFARLRTPARNCPAQMST